MLDWMHVITLVIAITAIEFGETARILCIFPTPSISHQLVFRGLTIALHEKGHDLVIITPDPLKDPSLKNYTEIDLSFLYDKNMLEVNWVQMRRKIDYFDLMSIFLPPIMATTDVSLGLPAVKKLYEPNSNEHFDLVIIEALWWFGFYPMVKRFDAPWIGVASLGLTGSVYYTSGNPVMPSHPATYELLFRVGEPLTFWKRVWDYIFIWGCLYRRQTEYISMAENIARKHFGDYGSSISEIERNVSIILVNQQLPLSFVRPSSPNIIEFGGFHVAKDPEPLSKHLKGYLDGADEGFVYMSLGTNVKSSTLPVKIKQAFITALSKLPYKVLWKYEDDVLPGKPKNVYALKWIPQQAVLAHPNIKVFIYQGGVQSTEEAVTHAVPLISFPVFGDQDGQTLKMVSIGVCKQLEITDFTADELVEAVMTVATNSSYKQNMIDLRSRLNDRPHDPLEHAVWWVEHVIRHRGTPYLHANTVDLPWYQRGDIDVIAFITIAFLFSFSLTIAILYRLIRLLCTSILAAKKEKLT